VPLGKKKREMKKGTREWGWGNRGEKVTGVVRINYDTNFDVKREQGEKDTVG